MREVKVTPFLFDDFYAQVKNVVEGTTFTRIILGDCLTELKTLDDNSISCCVTSPPYWGLRDYGTAKWVDGDDECDHIEQYAKDKGQASQAFKAKERQFTKVCGKCNAVRVDNQLGLEDTPNEYVENMLLIFREVKRVLKNNGTLWLNLGDTYAGKDLIGIPWRVAFTLQADGWWLRQDIIWHKPNVMPESVTDRCTKAHEYIFLLTKSAHYFYNMDAVKQKSTTGIRERTKYNGENAVDTKLRGKDTSCGSSLFRNLRSVWSISTQGVSDAHFAIFPEKLVEQCIKAGCEEGGTVLDPFTGSGTTGVVAKHLGRNFIGIELNERYCAMAKRRIQETNPMPIYQ